MRIGLLTLFTVLTIAPSASLRAEPPSAPRTPAQRAAEPAGATAATWDDSHMASRYQETPRSSRPRIIGESGYGALASGSAETQKSVPEGIAFTTQRQWEQGASFSKRPNASEASFVTGESAPIFRGSTLRAGAVSSGNRH